MERIVLFRYHNNPTVCLEQIKRLKKQNPIIKFYGLFGGVESNFSFYKILFDKYLENNYCIKNETYEWKWKNGDFAIIKWYNEIGKSLIFDMLHVIEWDLLLFKPLEELYNKIPKNGIGLTALNEISNLTNKWFWITENSKLSQWNKLMSYVKQTYNYNQNPYASLGPGLCLPQEFLKDYSSIKVPELCNDEIRIPLFGQILGYNLYNTGFYNRWFDAKEESFFNCSKRNIDKETIKNELANENGRRVFHPFRNRF